ncbi:MULTISPECIES: hypothetical protein [unclassified Bradyrhizobium]|uniref:hypothetical protein n=1 Tax=unclassified Bradyrhizobium TaxID=2631580 RepID=UPI0028F06E17|nr:MULTISPECIES: hypothetical protein [unclassified Bradyrhizobium]
MLSGIWDFLKTSEGASVTTAISTVVLTLTTMAYAWLTAILAKENRLLRKAGTEPQVIAYLAVHPRISGPLQFILANVGQGPAFDVRFRIVGGGDDFKNRAHLPAPEVALTAIPQGERYETFFGMGPEMFREPKLKPFSIEVSYRDLGKRVRLETFHLDIRQFEDMARVGGNPEQEVADAMKALVSELQKWTSRGLPVETVTRAERQHEQQEWRDQVRAEQA